jgi:hypothetical protein
MRSAGSMLNINICCITSVRVRVPGPSMTLGPHIVYCFVVNRHGGKIGVRSNSDGTAFFV